MKIIIEIPDLQKTEVLDSFYDLFGRGEDLTEEEKAIFLENYLIDYINRNVKRQQAKVASDAARQPIVAAPDIVIKTKEIISAEPIEF